MVGTAIAPKCEVLGAYQLAPWPQRIISAILVICTGGLLLAAARWYSWLWVWLWYQDVECDNASALLVLCHYPNRTPKARFCYVSTWPETTELPAQQPDLCLWLWALKHRLWGKADPELGAAEASYEVLLPQKVLQLDGFRFQLLPVEVQLEPAPQIHPVIIRFAKDVVQALATEAELPKLSPATQGHLKHLYGPNSMPIPQSHWSQVLLGHVVHPLFLIQIYSVAVWIYYKYVIYSYFVIAVSTASVIFNVAMTQRQASRFKRVTSITGTYFRLNQSQKQTAALTWEPRETSLIKAVHTAGSPLYSMGGRDQETSSAGRVQVVASDLVVGDLVQIEKGVMPADILLLQGDCMVDEFRISGENHPLKRLPLSKNYFLNGNSTQKDVKTFSDENCLLAGSSVIGTSQSEDRPCIGLVIRTGFNSRQGHLIHTMVHTKTPTASLTREILILMLIMLVMGAGFSGWNYHKFQVLEIDSSGVLLGLLNVPTVVLPPAMLVALVLLTSCSIVRLKRKHVYVQNPNCITLAGTLDVLCIDKTGTITERKTDFDHILPVAQGHLTTSRAITDCRSAPYHLQVLMATCHGLVSLGDHVHGDVVDVALFNASGWKLHQESMHQAKDMAVGHTLSRKLLKQMSLHPGMSSDGKDRSTFSRPSPDMATLRALRQSNDGGLLAAAQFAPPSLAGNVSADGAGANLPMFDPNPHVHWGQPDDVHNSGACGAAEAPQVCIELDKGGKLDAEERDALPALTSSSRGGGLGSESAGWSEVAKDRPSAPEHFSYRSESARVAVPAERKTTDLKSMWGMRQSFDFRGVRSKSGSKAVENAVGSRKSIDNSQPATLGATRAGLEGLPPRPKTTGGEKTQSRLKANLDFRRASLEGPPKLEKQRTRRQSKAVSKKQGQSMGGYPNKGHVWVQPPGEDARPENLFSIVLCFPFTSQDQRCTVIVEDPDDRLVLYIKGAAECVANLCSHDTKPADFEKAYSAVRKPGRIVLGIAMRVLTGFKREHLHLFTRQALESGSQFLGFIVLRNAISKQGSDVVMEVQRAGLRTIMVTGDDLPNSLQVALRAKLVPEDKPVLMMDKLGGKGTFVVARSGAGIFGTEDGEGVPGVNETPMSFHVLGRRRTTEADTAMMHDLGFSFKLFWRGSEKHLKPLSALRQLEKNPVLLCAITGSAFQHLVSNPKVYPVLALVLKKSIIFARMRPQLKQQLMLLLGPRPHHVCKAADQHDVQLPSRSADVEQGSQHEDRPEPAKAPLPFQNLRTAFCGDGENDMAALRAAVVGLTLLGTSGSSYAPIGIPVDQGLLGIKNVILEGRCSTANTVLVIQFVLVYAFIQLISTATLYDMGLMPSDPQYLIQDMGFCTAIAAAMGLTSPPTRFIGKAVPLKLISADVLLPIVVQWLICTAYVLGAQTLLKNSDFFQALGPAFSDITIRSPEADTAASPPSDLLAPSDLNNTRSTGDEAEYDYMPVLLGAYSAKRPEASVTFLIGLALLIGSSVAFKCGIRSTRHSVQRNFVLIIIWILQLAFTWYLALAPEDYVKSNPEGPGVVGMPLDLRAGLLGLVLSCIASQVLLHLATLKLLEMWRRRHF